MSLRPTHAARVRTAIEGGESLANTSRVLVRHHRTPVIEWSVDRATGGHMLHLALAQCIFNNVMRLARERGVDLEDCRVVADGGFNDEGTASTGMYCTIELSGHGDAPDLEGIARMAFDDSSVAAVLRHGAPVDLTSVRVTQLPGAGGPIA